MEGAYNGEGTDICLEKRIYIELHADVVESDEVFLLTGQGTRTPHFIVVVVLGLRQ